MPNRPALPLKGCSTLVLAVLLDLTNAMVVRFVWASDDSHDKKLKLYLPAKLYKQSRLFVLPVSPGLHEIPFT